MRTTSSARLSRFTQMLARLMPAVWSGSSRACSSGASRRGCWRNGPPTIRLTPSTHFSDQSSLNSTGTLVTFSSTADLTGGNPDENYELFQFDTLSNAFAQITNTVGSGPFFVSSGLTSADGSRIALTSNADLTGGNSDGSRELFLYDTTMHTFTQITSGGGVGGVRVSQQISPNQDGTRIAFTFSGDLTGGNPDGNDELFLYDFQAIPSPNHRYCWELPCDPWSRRWHPIVFTSNADLTGSNPDGD